MAVDVKVIHLVVLDLFNQEVVVPPVSMSTAGGNSVTITNHLDKPVTVKHGGHLDAPSDPFTVPAKGAGGPGKVTYAVNANSDRAGTIFSLHFEASIVRALGFSGDPTIIIL
jgi:hypothetical protein